MPVAAPKKPVLIVDSHVRVVAWLHIALALLSIGFACVLALGVGAMSLWGNAGDSSKFHTVFGVVLAAFAFFPMIEIFGAVQLMGGRPSGKVITMGFSVLHILNFPVGAAISCYSFWVLLRDPPKAPVATAPRGPRPAPQPVPQPRPMPSIRPPRPPMTPTAAPGAPVAALPRPRPPLPAATAQRSALPVPPAPRSPLATAAPRVARPVTSAAPQTPSTPAPPGVTRPR